MRETFLYQINVTRDCNLRCSHCYIHSDNKAASRTMTTAQFLDLCRQITAHMQANPNYRHAEIHVIGGEPTMLGLAFYEEVVPTARTILSRMPQVHTLRLVSNLLGEESIAIARLFDFVSTSFEFATRFPKPALEERWRERIRTLQHDGKTVAVTTAITKPVIERGPAKLLEYFLELELHHVHLGFFVPAGDGLVHIDTVAPTNEATSRFLIEAAEWYLPRRESHDMLVNPVESVLAAFEAGEPIDDIVCPIISGSVDVNWDGNAVTCIQAGGAEKPQWLGNVFKTPIRDFVKTPPFRREVALASTPRSACAGCDEWSVCMGGCGVLHGFWDGSGECPGYKGFLKHMRRHFDEGVRSRQGGTGQMNATLKTVTYR